MSSEIMWYYQFEEGRAGPVPQSRLIDLITAGTVQRGALVWREGMTDWQEAFLTELNTYFTVKSANCVGRSSGNEGIRDYLTSRFRLPQKLRVWYLIFGISLCVSVFLATLGPIAWLSAIVSTFFGLLIMYHVWGVIPENKRMLSPFVTVILMIIPVFNLVWIFYCYYIGARKLNQELVIKGITDYKVNEYYALGYSVCAIIMTVLFVISFITGMMFASTSLALVVVIVFLQVFMMRSFLIGIVKLL